MNALPVEHLSAMQEYTVWFVSGFFLLVAILVLCVRGAIESFRRSRGNVNHLFLEAEASAAAVRSGVTVDVARERLLAGWVLDEVTGTWQEPEADRG